MPKWYTYEVLLKTFMLKSGSTTAFSFFFKNNFHSKKSSISSCWKLRIILTFVFNSTNFWPKVSSFRTILGSAQVVKFGAKHRNQQTITCQVLAELNKIWSYLLRYLSNIFQCKWFFFWKKGIYFNNKDCDPAAFYWSYVFDLSEDNFDICFQ